MDQQQFDEYCNRIKDFTSRVSQIDIPPRGEEIFLSRKPCAVCSREWSFRKEFFGYSQGQPIFFEACLDCSHCLENQKTPDHQSFIHRIK